MPRIKPLYANIDSKKLLQKSQTKPTNQPTNNNSNNNNNKNQKLAVESKKTL